MPELEEGNLWIRGTAPLNITLERQVEISKQARAIMASLPRGGVDRRPARPARRRHRHRRLLQQRILRAAAAGEGLAELVEQTGWRSWLWGAKRPRTKPEVVTAMNAELEQKIPGVVWNFSQNIRDNVMEALSGVKGDNSVKIFGPDIDELEKLATKVKNILQEIHGIENVGVFHIRGQSHLEFRVDPEKCEKWGVMTADVNNVVSSALGASAMSSMVEGEKLFDIADPLAASGCGAARRRSWTSRWTSSTTRWSCSQGPGVVPVGVRHGLGDAPPPRARWPTPPTRSRSKRRGCGCATWSRRWARTARPTPTASSSAPAPRTSTARTASA